MITSRHVLSAAHCMNPALYMVRLGEHDLKTENDGRHEDVRVTHGDAHRDYDKVLGINDIAIVYLAKDVKYNGKLINCSLLHFSSIELMNFAFL